ncbi:hypothetical protein [Undibacterium sp.]|jgi:hypothetical protein|uniref:hypothetical protein n=1 Tax=Undibacterium sp. TaxID=1914977 RepID=UPI00273091D3|nr:hypothetical protein [Undibacterium sp.]MDP1976366.1 hypothetical protein [Undibacterium sp.]
MDVPVVGVPHALEAAMQLGLMNKPARIASQPGVYKKQPTLEHGCFKVFQIIAYIISI